MKHIKIGYQGIKNSNTYEAATILAEKLFHEDYELVPLVSSLNVFHALSTKDIDYGLLAVETAVVGIVPETNKAMKSIAIDLISVDEISLDIHHCIFKRSDTPISQITKIASHPEAIRECSAYIKNNHSAAKLLEVEDTALSARKLREGTLDRHTAIICSKNAGIDNHLSLIAENIENLEHNWTLFKLFSSFLKCKDT